MVENIAIIKSKIEKYLHDMNIHAAKVTITRFDTDKTDHKMIYIEGEFRVGLFERLITFKALYNEQNNSLFKIELFRK